MKRDIELARQVLLELEKVPYTGTPVNIKIEGYSNDEIVYHVLLLSEAGLIEAYDLGFGDITWMPIRLTWAGHEFLDVARDEKRWSRAKETMIGKGEAIVFEVLQELLMGMFRDSVRPD